MPDDTSSTTPAVHFLTLGCPKNEVDSDRMRGLVDSSAFELAKDAQDADIVVVNTCAFIEDAVTESVAEILDLAEEWRPGREGRRIVVAGCMPSRYGGELGDALTEADAFVPVAEESSLLDVLEQLTGVTATAATAPNATPTRLGTTPFAYLQVADGCHRSCSFCTIPSIRGPYRSRPLADLRAEAELLASRGAREIVLIGQDISSYGRDLDETVTLSDVLKELATVDGVEWIRLMYVQPDGVTNELLETMAALPQVCHYIDIPLQHVVPDILRAMHRSGSAQDFTTLLSRIREAMPDVIIRTTLIAGFPGETEADVEAVLDFLGDSDLDYVGVFPYSPEEGTAAAELDGLPDKATRLQRAQRIRDAADKWGVESAERLIGKQIEALALGLDEDGVPVGRWRGQAPDVDGIVYLDREIPVGTICDVRITSSLGYDLEGEVV